MATPQAASGSSGPQGAGASARAPGDLTDRVVVVTGGNGGIGLALAKGVAAAGASVVIWGRSEQKNAAAVRELEAMGAEVLAVACDVSHEQQVVDAFALSVGRFGAVDSLFANAGIAGEATPFTEMTYEQWRAVLDINLDGTFFSLREAARHFVDRGTGGSLVAVSSIVEFYGAARKEHYGVSKSGMTALIRALAVELAPHGVRCNSLLPGWTETDLMAPGAEFMGGVDYDSMRKSTVRRTPMARWAMPEEIGLVAAFLADPRIQFHTGDEIVVDGGYTIF